MKKTDHTFHAIVGTDITANILKSYVTTLSDLLDKDIKAERGYKRTLGRLMTAINDTSNITSFLLKRGGIKEFADKEADSIETVLFLASDMDIETREKYITLGMKMIRESK